MNLAIDIGNSRHKIGLFSNGNLLESKLITDWTTEDLLAYCNQSGVRRIILSSVGQPDERRNQILEQHFDFLELTPQTPLPFENLYQTPHTLGKDRLAAVAGLQALLPRQHALAVDCGTCIKYDLITASGEYPGGNIAPGVKMRIQAMHAFTARLPEVDMEMPAEFIGKSTETALQNGACRGAALEINGFIELFQTRFSPLTIVLTGGDAPFLQPFLPSRDYISAPHLTLYGLNNILTFHNF